MSVIRPRGIIPEPEVWLFPRGPLMRVSHHLRVMTEARQRLTTDTEAIVLLIAGSLHARQSVYRQFLHLASGLSRKLV
jgi:hypothetical protein